MDEACSIDAERVVVIDETGFNLAMVPLHGWGTKGRRLSEVAPGRTRGQRKTLLGAMTTQGRLEEFVFEGYLNLAIFLIFIGDFLVPRLRAGDVVIMDNLNIHRNPRVRELIESVGARVVFLPPYMPQLNPIEFCWSKVKTLVRQQKPRDFEALVEAIDYALSCVSERDARGWFSHCGFSEALSSLH